MKQTITFFLSILLLTNVNLIAQDNFTISSSVKFDTKPDFRKSNTTEDADVIIFTITVKNNSDELIPDLGATKRSEHLNFLVNDSIRNPISLYNGVELINDHMLRKGQQDTYEWWIYADDAYGEVFTVQWQYMDRFSEKYLVTIEEKQIRILT